MTAPENHSPGVGAVVCLGVIIMPAAESGTARLCGRWPMDTASVVAVITDPPYSSGGMVRGDGAGALDHVPAPR